MKVSNRLLILSIILVLTITFSIPKSFSDSEFDTKLEFAASLEETLGHFWAIEKNLDDKNAELALVHATHPISELYDLMKPQLQETDPMLDTKVRTTLLELQHKATTTVSRQQAQKAIDDAKDVVEVARNTIVGEKLSQDPMFKMKLMQNLLETSINEYGEAVENGKIYEMAEFQDGSAFVWRSQQIFNSIKNTIDEHAVEEMDESFAQLQSIFEHKDTPENMATTTKAIIHEIDEVLGEANPDKELTHYVENIRSLLSQTKTEYANGNNDLALSLSTKAYLDNFEYLEAPLVDAGEKELMEEIETMMRIELRDLIKNNASQEEVNNLVDTILIKMDTVAVIVPEFGTVVLIVLMTGIVSTILLSRTKINFIQKI